MQTLDTKLSKIFATEDSKVERAEIYEHVTKTEVSEKDAERKRGLENTADRMGE